MRRALELGVLGSGLTLPNPRVGAVLVRGGKILGEGFHRRAGGPHAEVNVVTDARRRGHSVAGATLYVTLEPCSTQGRTPPCTELILREKIARVVFGATDPNPAHAGAAMRLLRKAGVEVSSGLLAEEATALNRDFNWWIVHRRPWVMAKMALSLDGRIVTPAGDDRWLTSPEARTVAHELRWESDAILVGEELENPGKPFVVILGGAKVSDKIKVIDRLLEKADTILIGGAMAYTFALAQGKKIGKSLSEPDKIDIAKQALEKAKAKGVKFLLPIDTYVVENFDFKARTVSPGKYLKPGEGIPDGWEGVDIGPETVKLFSAEVASAKTILWNGPMGVFEVAECAVGTFAIAKAIAANSGAVSIIGGGDSVSAIKKAGVSDKVSFISTGGGASLEFLEGKELPGVASIPDKK